MPAAKGWPASLCILYILKKDSSKANVFVGGANSICLPFVYAYLALAPV
jgi:hypothetical protein